MTNVRTYEIKLVKDSFINLSVVETSAICLYLCDLVLGHLDRRLLCKNLTSSAEILRFDNLCTILHGYKVLCHKYFRQMELLSPEKLEKRNFQIRIGHIHIYGLKNDNLSETKYIFSTEERTLSLVPAVRLIHFLNDVCLCGLNRIKRPVEPVGKFLLAGEIIRNLTNKGEQLITTIHSMYTYTAFVKSKTPAFLTVHLQKDN